MRSTLFTLALLMPVIAVAQNAAKSLEYLGERPPGMTPVKFAPGLISLPGQSEFGSVFSRKGDEFYYAIDIKGKAETWFMRRNNDQWTKPERLIYDDVFSFNDPMLSPDESRLFFISDKSTDNSRNKKDYDIWYIQRNGNKWSDPVNAGPAINSNANEYYVSFAKNGTMYFSSNRATKEGAGGNYNIWSAAMRQGSFQSATALDDAVNSQHYEADVFIADDESYLIFCGDRPEGRGRGDLYISFKKPDGSWTKAKNMGNAINTTGHELCPFVTADGKYLFYTSNQDIYWVDARIIDTMK